MAQSKSLRSDPRFADLLRRMNLQPEARLRRKRDVLILGIGGLVTAVMQSQAFGHIYGVK